MHGEEGNCMDPGTRVPVGEGRSSVDRRRAYGRGVTWTEGVGSRPAGVGFVENPSAAGAG